MTAIVDFITARLAEDERIALAAGDPRRTPGQDRWTFDNMQVHAQDSYGVLVVRHTWPREGEHITRHDPARTLRQVAAIRGVLESVEALDAALSGGEHHGLTSYTYGALEDLAAIWSDHDAYQEAWKPCQ